MEITDELLHIINRGFEPYGIQYSSDILAYHKMVNDLPRIHNAIVRYIRRPESREEVEFLRNYWGHKYEIHVQKVEWVVGVMYRSASSIYKYPIPIVELVKLA